MRYYKGDQTQFLNDLSIAKTFAAHPNFVGISDFVPDDNYFTYALDYY